MSSALRSAVRVVAFDLDGTILEPGKIISSEVIKALRSLRDCGVRSVIASGRPVDFQLELLQRYALGADSGCFQALVCDERELYVRDVSTTVAGFRPDEEWNG